MPGEQKIHCGKYHPAVDRALPERGDDRSDRSLGREAVPGRTDAAKRGAGHYSHCNYYSDPFLCGEIRGPDELSGIPDSKTQASRSDLQKAPETRHELSGESDHRGDRAGIGGGSGPAGELFWPVRAPVLLRFHRAGDPVRSIHSGRKLADRPDPITVRSADPGHDHDGAEDRQEDPGKILGPVHETRQHFSREPAGHDHPQDLSGGRL